MAYCYLADEFLFHLASCGLCHLWRDFVLAMGLSNLAFLVVPEIFIAVFMKGINMAIML